MPGRELRTSRNKKRRGERIVNILLRPWWSERKEKEEPRERRNQPRRKGEGKRRERQKLQLVRKAIDNPPSSPRRSRSTLLSASLSQTSVPGQDNSRSHSTWCLSATVCDSFGWQMSSHSGGLGRIFWVFRDGTGGGGPAIVGYNVPIERQLDISNAGGLE